MSHFLKHLLHNIKHWFSSAGNTASSLLSDPRVTNGLKIAQLGGKIIEEISDSNVNYQTPPPQSENSNESYTASKEEKEIIESFKTFLDSLSKRTEQIENKLTQFSTEISTNKNYITQLQDELKKQKELNTNLQLQINTIVNSHDKSKKQIELLEAKQKLRDKQLIFAFVILSIAVISISYLVYKLYYPD